MSLNLMNGAACRGFKKRTRWTGTSDRYETRHLPAFAFRVVFLAVFVGRHGALCGAHTVRPQVSKILLRCRILLTLAASYSRVTEVCLAASYSRVTELRLAAAISRDTEPRIRSMFSVH